MIAPFLKAVVAKRLLAINLALAILYFIGLFVLFQRGNIYLYLGLMIGEVFHLWQLATLIHAAWEPRIKHPFDPAIISPVDVYITVAGEPVEVVARTVAAAAAMDYPNFRVYILNDGRVANKPNWQQIEAIADQYGSGVRCITRTVPGAAKAGNINHALKLTNARFVAILDCDLASKVRSLSSSPAARTRVNMPGRSVASHQPSMYASPMPSEPWANTRAYRRWSCTCRSVGCGPSMLTPAYCSSLSARSFRLSSLIGYLEWTGPAMA